MSAKEVVAIARFHARCGEEYLDTLHTLGVWDGPSVTWGTGTAGDSVAVIHWPEGGESVAGVAPDELVEAVVRRVLARMDARN